MKVFPETQIWLVWSSRVDLFWQLLDDVISADDEGVSDAVYGQENPSILQLIRVRDRASYYLGATIGGDLKPG